MKLLSSRETENEKRDSGIAESSRITAIRSELSREEQEFNKFKKSINEQRKQIKEDFDGKILALNDELSGIEREVIKLKIEREELLRPLDDIPEKITKNLAVTDEMLVYLDNRKKQVNEEKKKFEDENIRLAKERNDLAVRNESLDEREEAIAANEVKLKDREETAAENIASFNHQANKRERELMGFEESLNNKEVELSVRKELVAKDKEKIVQDRKHIESQQATLVAAYAEARKNNII